MTRLTGDRRVLAGVRIASRFDGRRLAGFRVFAWPSSQDVRWRVRSSNASVPTVPEAAEGRNATWAFHSLSGFAGWAHQREGAIAQVEHSIVAIDTRCEWLPLRVQRPLPAGSLLTWQWATGGRGELPAWPSCRAPVPDGYLAIRATVFDLAQDTPAAWALLEVTVAGVRSSGVADQDGRVVVFVPVPRPVVGVEPAKQSWPVAVAARYGRLIDSRAAVGPLPGCDERNRWRADLPTLEAIDAQPVARLLAAAADAAGAASTFVPGNLAARGELVLASDDKEGRLLLHTDL